MSFKSYWKFKLWKAKDSETNKQIEIFFFFSPSFLPFLFSLLKSICELFSCQQLRWESPSPHDPTKWTKSCPQQAWTKGRASTPLLQHLLFLEAPSTAPCLHISRPPLRLGSGSHWHLEQWRGDSPLHIDNYQNNTKFNRSCKQMSQGAYIHAPPICHQRVPCIACDRGEWTGQLERLQQEYQVRPKASSGQHSLHLVIVNEKEDPYKEV